MSVLAAVNIDVTLGGAPILREVSLAVLPGELVALVGPNGAGKSTLLGALTGDIPVDAGEVLLRGRPLRTWDGLDAARTRAVQTQQSRVSFAFTGEEVVRMGRAPWHRTPEADRDDAVVAAAMAMTETTGFATRRLPSLSGGESARISFSRVLAQETSVLLLDEPTAALDLRHQEMELLHMRQRAEQGVAVVIVLHDLSLAGAYADRIVLLDQGRVVADDPPRKVLRADLLERVYRQRVSIVTDPVSGDPIVVPVRQRQQAKAVA